MPKKLKSLLDEIKAEIISLSSFFHDEATMDCEAVLEGNYDGSTLITINQDFTATAHQYDFSDVPSGTPATMPPELRSWHLSKNEVAEILAPMMLVHLTDCLNSTCSAIENLKMLPRTTTVFDALRVLNLIYIKGNLLLPVKDQSFFVREINEYLNTYCNHVTITRIEEFQAGIEFEPEAERKKNTIIPDNLITLAVAAKEFHVSTVTLKRLIKEKKIKSYRPKGVAGNSKHLVDAKVIAAYYPRRR